MPELPEVETTRRGIAPHVLGEKLAGVDIFDARLRWPVPPQLSEIVAGQAVERLERRSKYLLFHLTRGTLLIHLGMTGSLRVLSGSASRRPHDHVDLRFGNGVTLRYHDPRRFGAILWLDSDPLSHPLLARLGPEPLSPQFSVDHLALALRSRSLPIKQALMNNAVVVGVGNIYANEALFRAGIRPTCPANRVGRQRLGRLVDAVRSTLEEAIAAGGSTLRDYVNGAGEPGQFQLHCYVYGRTGEPCRVCGGVIRTLRQGGRSSFFCPRCQR